jgi:hypothetical protein
LYAETMYASRMCAPPDAGLSTPHDR